MKRDEDTKENNNFKNQSTQDKEKKNFKVDKRIWKKKKKKNPVNSYPCISPIPATIPAAGTSSLPYTL